ncbi:Alpha/Beta hydrolase protein [Thelonectria olida]|uniref:Alpha/Beta hydrolase protein n=1 Tax=Thelonectria olida TaxID=1576542 RepID=A0A9P9AIK5_9HYPO|nr:Alpha/Beta hydrolase protein [Thelonectria olida]
MASKITYFTAGDNPNVDAGCPSENESLTLAYRTYGSPGNPAILIPTCFSGKINSTLSFLYDSDESALKGFYVVVCGLLGGSESSSPSNAPPGLSGNRFPKISYEDNIHLQYQLCHALGIKKLAAYIGFSMAGQQGYYMAAMYPDFAQRLVVLASSAQTSWHNKSFLEGPKAALESSLDWHGGRYTKAAMVGTRAFARVYSTWALSPAWFRQEQWKRLGCSSVEDYLVKFWGQGMGSWDAHDLMCMMQCWRRGDISDHGPIPGDLPAALASIQAKVLLMPSRTDAYFPPEDSLEELKHLKLGELKVIESAWGHLAGGEWGPPEDQEYIKKEVQRFLSTS